MSKLYRLVGGTVLTFILLTTSVRAFDPDPFNEYGKWLPWESGKELLLTQPPNVHLANYGYYATDFAARGGDMNTLGTFVNVVSDGVVEQIVEDIWNDGYGRSILIDHQNGYKTEYHHLQVIFLIPSDIGKPIRKGQTIATIGATGNVTGANLEFITWHNGQRVKHTADGRPYQGSYSWSGLQPTWISPIDNFDKFTFSPFISNNEIREDDPNNPWDPPVIDPLQRYVEKYGYMFPSGKVAEPVNTALGSYLHRNVDLEFPQSVGPALKFERFYNSPDQFVSFNGAGWMNDYNLQLMAHDNFRYSVKFGDGRGEVFREGDSDPRTFNGDFVRESAEGTGNLSRAGEDGGYKFTYTGSDQTKYIFNSDKEGNKWGKIEKLTSREGKSLNFEYNDAGKLSKVSNDFGQSLSFEFGDSGLLNKVSSSDGRSVSYGYNFDGRLATVTKPNGGVWQYNYDASGRIIEAIDANGKRFVSNTYDDSGRVISQTDAEGYTTKFEYRNETGFLGAETGSFETKITDPNGGVLTQIHDQNQYLTRETRADGATTTYEYFKGRVSRKVLPDGAVFEYSYDDRGNRTRERRPDGYVANTNYNDRNLPVEATDPTGTVRMEYNDLGRMTKKTDQLGSVTSYEYNNVGQMTAMIDALGNRKEFTYNSNGYLESELEVTSQAKLNYQYDAAGNKIATTDALGNVTRSEFNAIAKPVKLIDAKGESKQFFYDLNGNLIREIDEAGIAKDIEVNGNENVTKITYNTPQTGSLSYSITSEHDLFNQDGDTADVYSRPDNPKAETWIGTGINKDKSYLGMMFHGGKALPPSATITSAKIQIINNRANSWIDTGFKVYAEANSTPIPYSVDALPGNRFLTSSQTSYRANEMWKLGSTWEIDVTSSIQELVDNGRAGKDIALIAKGDSDKWGRKFIYNYRMPIVRDYLPKLVIEYSLIAPTHVERFTYDGLSNKTSFQDRNGNITKYSYDNANRMVKEEYFNAANENLGSKSYTYNNRDQIVAQIDERGFETHYSYDSMDRITRETNALGHYREFRYDLVGNLISQTDYNGNATRYEYDALGRRTARIDAAGARTTYAFDKVGNPVKTTDPSNAQSSQFYDSRGQLIAAVNARGFQSKYEYDLTGRLVRQQNFAGAVTTFEYDANGNLLSQTDAFGAKTTFGYDIRGNMNLLIDPKGGRTEFAYNALNERFREENALRQVRRFEFDPNGNLTKMTGEDGSVMTYTYDGRGRTVAEADQAGKSIVKNYDAAGNLTKLVDKNGNTTENNYDPTNKLVQITNALGEVRKFEYNPNGTLAKLIDEAGNSTRYEYNSLGNKVAEIDAVGNVKRWQYDSTGRLASEFDFRGSETKFAYDETGNLHQITDRNGAVTTFSYDASNKLTKVEQPEGVSNTKEYDLLGRLVAEANAKSEKTIYEYDLNSNITRVVDARGNATKYQYDILNRQTKATDALGQTQTTNYDIVGRPTKVTDKSGATTSYSFDALGNILESKNALGQVTKFSYDASGNLINMTNPLGHTTKYSYDQLNRLIKTTLPDGSEVSQAYSPLGQVNKVVDALGRTAKREYNPLGQVSKEIDQLGFASSYKYDPNGNVAEIINAIGAKSRFEYDKMDRLTKATNALGNYRLAEYDQLGRTIKTIDEIGAETKFEYDTVSRKLREIDARGGTTKFDYDAAGNLTTKELASGSKYIYSYDSLNRLTSEKDPLGGVQKYSYTPTNLLANSTDELGKQTRYEYDPIGQLTRRIDALNAATKYAYDAAGNLIKQTDALGNTINFAYDSVGRQVGKKLPGGENYKYSYDAKGQLVKETKPSGSFNNYSYDERGLLTSTVNPLGHTEKFSYDELGRLRETTNAENQTTKYSYDALGRLIGVTNALGAVTKYEYSKRGELTKEINANNAAIFYEYNLTGQKTKETNALGNSWSYSYDAVGNLNSKTDANGVASKYEYDALSRLTSINYPDNSLKTSYQYDAVGNVTKITKGSHTNSFDYDSLSQLTKVGDSRGAEIAYQYDSVGNRISIKYPDQKVANYSYNSNSLLTKLSVDSNSGKVDTTFQYDANQNLVLQQNGNQTKTKQSYDLADRLTKIEHIRVADETFLSFNYELNRLGDQVKAEIVGKESDGDIVKALRNYSYDSIGQLISVSQQRSENNAAFKPEYSETYAYDSVGNRTRYSHKQGNAETVVEYLYNAASQLVSDSNNNYSYDKNGARTMQKAKAGGDFAQYSYDQIGNLTNVTSKFGSANYKFAYSYDGLGRRIAKNNLSEGNNKASGIAQVNSYYDGNTFAELATYYTRSTDYNLHTNLYQNFQASKPTVIATDDIAEREAGSKSIAYDEKEVIVQAEEAAVASAPLASAPIASAPVSKPEFNLALKCVKLHDDGSLTAYFGYNNGGSILNLESSTLSSTATGTAPKQLLSGNRDQAFTANSKDTIDWKVSVAGETREIQAKIDSSRCEGSTLFTAPETVERLSYHHRDSLGSTLTRSTFEGNNQAKLFGQTIFGVYGARDSAELPAYPNARGFAPWQSVGYSGEVFDVETGLNYYGSRYYDSATGVWNKQDSFRGELTDPSSRHRYSFVANNPVNNVDLYGFCDPQMQSCATVADQFSTMKNSQRQMYQDEIKWADDTSVVYQGNVDRLNQQIPGLHATMVATKWSAYYAQMNYYDYITMGGMVGRLQARGYTMDYATVNSYVGNKINETGRVYAVKQSQYVRAAGNYYGAVAARDFYSSEIPRLHQYASDMKQESVDFEAWVGKVDNVYGRTGVYGQDMFNRSINDSNWDSNSDYNNFYSQNGIDGELQQGFDKYFNRYFTNSADSQEFFRGYFAEGIGTSFNVAKQDYEVRKQAQEQAFWSGLKVVGAIVGAAVCTAVTAGVAAAVCIGAAAYVVANETMNTVENVYTATTGNKVDVQSSMLQMAGVSERNANFISGGLDALSNIALVTVGTIATAGVLSTVAPTFTAGVSTFASSTVGSVAQVGIGLVGVVGGGSTTINAVNQYQSCEANGCSADAYKDLGYQFTIGASEVVGGALSIANGASGLANKFSGSNPSNIASETVKTKPMQEHHFATNKSKTYSPEFSKITDKYSLNLDESWNKQLMPHQGRHPNAYHNWVLQEFRNADYLAQGNQSDFLEYLNSAVFSKVQGNPDMLYSNYWNK